MDRCVIKDTWPQGTLLRSTDPAANITRQNDATALFRLNKNEPDNSEF